MLCVLGYPALGKECIYHVNLNQSSDLSLAVVQAIAFRGSSRIYVSLDDASIEVFCCFLGFFGVRSIKLKYDYAKFEFAYTLADLSASFVRNQNEVRLHHIQPFLPSQRKVCYPYHRSLYKLLFSYFAL